MVGQRAAGYRTTDVWTSNAIYGSNTGLFGELGIAKWFRKRGGDSSSMPPDTWRIALEFCGEFVYRAAVIDDFGDLVVVPGR